MFESYAKHFGNLQRVKNCEISSVLCKWVLMNKPFVLSFWDDNTKLVPGSFSCFLEFLLRHCWNVKLGEFKTNQKYFAKSKEILKCSKNYHNSCKSPKVMWKKIAKNLLGVFEKSFYLRFCFKWSVKKHCIENIVLTVWEIFFMKIIVKIITKYQIPNSFLLLFCSFVETKKMNQIFS